MPSTIFSLFLIVLFLSDSVLADGKNVSGLIVSGLEQRVDDEEAPFDFHSNNKIHSCGGKPSNVYRVYSEYDTVALRRFNLVLEALKTGLTLSLITDDCEGRVLTVKSLRLDR